MGQELRRSLSERSVADIVGLLSMILGEAVDEGLIGSNPCRRLRLNSGDQPERPHADPDEVTTLAGRVSSVDNATLIVTAAYTGMRWGELAGLQWSRVDPDKQEIHVDARDGALHELHGKLELGPPKTPASVRTVHLPEFLAELLTQLRREKPTARFVFTGQDGGLHRRSNFRRRVWLPALRGGTTLGWSPIKPHMHLHDLRHTHKTWMIEDGVPEVLQHKRMGHKFRGVMGVYSHVTRPMIDAMLAGLQARWEHYGANCGDHFGAPTVVKISCSHSAPTNDQ
ncbi:integrase [Saccharothrix tamanrassetensis]|uniref:Integrase n=1 Tax=Saccharothrix tamanrassetensis TaxID=1051531 RepID=A0A841CUG9_9PSEU|nr:site-specific integrase [Saccharothrix tamanrassetensis]MBB5960473.1 integrase [Saccharothrix tamanrassetensis]